MKVNAAVRSESYIVSRIGALSTYLKMHRISLNRELYSSEVYVLFTHPLDKYFHAYLVLDFNVGMLREMSLL